MGNKTKVLSKKRKRKNLENLAKARAKRHCKSCKTDDSSHNVEVQLDEEVYQDNGETKSEDDSNVEDNYVTNEQVPRKRVRQRPTRDTYDSATLIREERRARDDEYVIFGEYVAHKLRKLPNKHAKVATEHFINKILFNAEIGKFDNIIQRHTNTGLTAGANGIAEYNMEDVSGDVDSAYNEKDLFSVDEMETVKIKLENE